MLDNNSNNKTTNTLKEIFKRHQNERICVIGTMCCGKTTLIKQLAGYNCIDMDDDFWPQASEAEYHFYSQRPFTKEMYSSLYHLFYERLSTKPGYPSFGVYILDCEAVVYLDISDQLLKTRCKRRGDTDFTDAYNLKMWIEADCDQHKAKGKKIFYHLAVME